jgi:transposase-like protein
MLGPCIFFHCSTYQRFFSHLRTKLNTDINTEVGFCDLVVRSDEEKAILKAINQSFPSAQQLLCQRHLEENVRRHMQKK